MGQWQCYPLKSPPPPHPETATASLERGAETALGGTASVRVVPCHCRPRVPPPPLPKEPKERSAAGLGPDHPESLVSGTMRVSGQRESRKRESRSSSSSSVASSSSSAAAAAAAARAGGGGVQLARGVRASPVPTPPGHPVVGSVGAPLLSCPQSPRRRRRARLCARDATLRCADAEPRSLQPSGQHQHHGLREQ
jgi:hypothetical protein